MLNTPTTNLDRQATLDPFDLLCAVFVTADWGTQPSLMNSPDLWRKFFASRHRPICAEAHRGGLDVVFHRCGNVMGHPGDLIDVGVDVLDSIQLGAMDLKMLAREYGGISDQHLARFTPQQIKDEIRATRDLRGGAFDNTNLLTPDIPLPNLVAMFEAYHNQ